LIETRTRIRVVYLASKRKAIKKAARPLPLIVVSLLCRDIKNGNVRRRRKM
jgi:hypothetical protein